MNFGKEIYEQAADIIKISARKGYRIIVAESCTGGLISAALTEVSGSSRVIEGGFFVYSNAMKFKQLGISEALYMEHGSVSKKMAYQMAQGALENSNANIALGVTGIAGPTGGTPEKPVGLVHICALQKNGDKFEMKYIFRGEDRAGIRIKTVGEALTILKQIIDENQYA
ncbi:MAG: CinA family protein [OCS116 cluster bacterium]|uniref:Damage-inducible protein CinA n=1 Tax=OCS116 cluster bacterium TaxID=2030921 RepID=A0A2A4YRC3_9PROT|nr:CinA family protein [OCS116 cluster bacterium]